MDSMSGLISVSERFEPVSSNGTQTKTVAVGDRQMVEEKTARELKKLLNELVDHSYGHHEAIHGLTKRVEELERKLKTLERKM